MKKLTILLATTLFTQAIVAQAGTISGVVNDSISNNAVAFAHIIILHQTDSTVVDMGITDERGNFRIDRLPYGNFLVRVSSLGDITQTVGGITLSPQQRQATVRIQINIDITMLDEAVIVDNRPSIEFRPDRRIVHIDLGASTGQSVADFLRSIPEVRIDGDNITLNTFTPTILVNGRPASAAMRDLSNLPASLISQVEVITNPSVRYNPEGLGGIINLRTRRAIEGVSGMIQGSFGSNLVGNAAGTLNYRTRKWNLFANAFDRFSAAGSDGTLKQESLSTGQTIFQTRIQDELVNRFSPRIGMDFEPNQMNVFSLYYEFSQRAGRMNSIITLEEKHTPISKREQVIDLDSRDHLIGFNYDRTFRNNSNLTFDFSQFFNYEPYLINLSTNESPQLRNNIFFNRQKSIGQLNYTAVLFENFGLETGVVLDWEQIEIEDILSGTSDANYHNTFGLDRLITAGYVSLTRRFGNLGVMAGLRGELVNETLNSTILDTTINRPLSLFPNVGISYRHDGINLSLNYSRRIRRPNIIELTPYERIDFNFPSQRAIGNPHLEPAFTNSVNFNAQLRTALFILSPSVSYMHTENDITEVYEFRANDSLTLSTRMNITTSQNILFNVSLDFHSRFFGVWRPILTFRSGRYLFDVPDQNRKRISNYHIDFLNNIFLPRNIVIALNITYFPETEMFASIVSARTDFNLTVRKRFGDNLILQISGRNILNSNPTTTFQGDDFQLHSFENPRTQAIFVGAMYRFGKPIRTRANIDLNLNRIEAQ